MPKVEQRLCEFCQKKLPNHLPRFCGLTCCWAWRRGRLPPWWSHKKGKPSWNAGTKGVMKANSGTFRKGQPAVNEKEVGTVTFRTDNNGKLRAWVKIADNKDDHDWELRAIVVWENQHGEVPKGSVVHHKNRDAVDDRIENLQVMTRAEHLKEHRPEHEGKRSHAAGAAATKRHAANRAKRGAVQKTP